jgi:flavin reductase
MTQAAAISAAVFRDAAARLAAAVNVVTTDGEGGRCGFTASAVCSVTDAPPTVLVCMNRASSQHGAFTKNLSLCVNVLAPDQVALSSVFAGKTDLSMEDRFALAEWSILASGAPALEGAAVSLDCRISQIIDHGTHSIFLAEVASVRMGGDDSGGLIWFGRAFHGVGSQNSAGAVSLGQP